MKQITISIVVAFVLIVGAFLLSRGGAQSNGGATNNVSIVGDKQIVEIRAKGGYLPRKSLAKAGVPTVLRFNTNGTFDCSLSVRIPSLGISKMLPTSGASDINLGSQQAGVLYGTCGMGMYPFEVDFQS